MGYSHYWYTPQELELEKWDQFLDRARKIIDQSEAMNIAIGNGHGDPGSSPVLSSDWLMINGRDDQPTGHWTTGADVRLPWPSAMASVDVDSSGEIINGNWSAGDLVNQRVAPEKNGLGQGAYETFGIERKTSDEDWENYNIDGWNFGCCKTSYRPYDITVTALLLALKHTFGDAVKVRTDGDDKDWIDAKIMCFQLFGFGIQYAIERDADGRRELVANERVTT